MTTKPLLVPVRLTGGIMHDTDCARGAESIEDAAHIDNECFDKTGHLRWGADYIMAEVPPFRASLRVVTHYHYRSSVYVELVDPMGDRYPMFLGDYVALMSTADVAGGWIEPLVYETCKKGKAYGIRLAIGPR